MKIYTLVSGKRVGYNCHLRKPKELGWEAVVHRLLLMNYPPTFISSTAVVQAAIRRDWPCRNRQESNDSIMCCVCRLL